MEEEEEEDQVVVVPGQRVGHVEDYRGGEGTYVRGSYHYASVVGRRRVVPWKGEEAGHDGGDGDDDDGANNARNKRADGAARGMMVVVVEKGGAAGAGTIVPRPGDVVTGVVVRVTPRMATVSIACVGQRAVAETFNGIVRAQDVRATTTGGGGAAASSSAASEGGGGGELELLLYKAFRPGDVVRAEVVSLGDARSYFLSTARNDLGVVSATHSVSGAPMVPLSWNLMLCPRTNMTEPRKVAKLFSSASSSPGK